jgi:pilus assembly protein TadC
MIKYLLLLFFNGAAFYILLVFSFGSGGLMDNIRKTHKIYVLEREKISNQLELEDLKAKLSHLKSLKSPDNHLLALYGRKGDNTILFKFSENQEEKNKALLQEKMEIYFPIYASIIIVVLVIISGNIALLWNFRKRRHG